MNTECPQVDVCEKTFENFEEKIKVANHRIDDLETKTEEINGINNTLAKLETLVCLQREDSIKRDKAIEEMNKNQREDSFKRDGAIREMSKTQVEINNTLIMLANSIKKTDDNVDQLDEKVDKLDDKFDEISKDNNINILQLLKEGIKYLVIAGLTSAGTYFLLLSKGLIQ